MSNVYVYYGTKKELKKILNLSYKMEGLSCVSGSIEEYCALELSNKLERRIKLFNFEIKRPRKITFLYNVISKSKKYTKDQYHKKWLEDIYNKVDKRKKYSDGTYKKMPKGVTKDNQESYNRGSGYQGGKSKTFCTNCRFTHKTYSYPMFVGKKYNGKKYNAFWKTSEKPICSNCGSQGTLIILDSSVRVPRQKANNKTWENFYRLFIYPLKK